MPAKRIIGLTGGIASGKSTIAHYLQQHHNLPISDADIYAREAVELDSPILSQIQQHFGTEILQLDGRLDRSRLGAIIFSQPPERTWLEQQIHPFVRQRLEKSIAHTESETIVLVVPLLIEAKMTDLVTEIWLVRCDRAQQLARLTTRDRLSLPAALARIDSQMAIDQKIPLADVVLNNIGDREFLLKQVDLAVTASRR